jgi:ribose 5-phosphate isomerase B
MKIVIASDHAGFNLKKTIIEYLNSDTILIELKSILKENEAMEIIDLGCNDTTRCDFPCYAKSLCEKINSDYSINYGILVCGSGIGMSMAANKIKGIRCALCRSSFDAQMSRQHNNANVIALGERVTGTDLALNIINTFLQHKFLGGRYQERMSQI